MSQKVTLKVMRCPTCGGNLKAENNTDAIVCVYCGNTIVPVNETSSVPVSSSVNESASTFKGVLKVEGIKTPSSALAYTEQFYEEYDWDTFAYAQSLSITEIDRLASSVKMTSADDKNTWFVCFKAISVPFLRKVDGCQQILNSIIEEYKKDNLDAYSKFDAYKRIAMMIISAKESVVANLKKYTSNAAKYGATATEIGELNAEIRSIVGLSSLQIYSNIESVPAIKAFIEEKNAKIALELASEGIDAKSEYERAKLLIYEKNYSEALSVLLSLKGYSDSAELIEKVDKYYLISDVLEIEGKRYYFKKESSESESLNLYPTTGEKVAARPIIRGIGKIITNYADILYYLDEYSMLKKYNLSTNAEKKIYDKAISKKSIFVYDRCAFLLASTNSDYNDAKEIIKLNLATGSVKTVVDRAIGIVSLTDNKMVYTTLRKGKDHSYEKAYETITGDTEKEYQENSESNSLVDSIKNFIKKIKETMLGDDSEKVEDKPYVNTSKLYTNVINVDTLEVTELGSEKISVEGFVNNYAVYTQEAPNKYNKRLCVKSLDSDEPAKLIEQNIFMFCDIIANKLFYYIGNSTNQSLININCDGTDRREWPLYISKVLFEQGGWLYFIRKAGHNSILCKFRLDGSKFSVIAADIDEFIDIKNGYLYYINYDSTLVKVRMDGSNLQELCEDVESVLAVKEDKIIFVSIDDRVKSEDSTQSGVKNVKSIYAVDFSGSGKIKLVYDIIKAKNYDENTVYYITSKKIKSYSDDMDESVAVLHSIDVETNSVEKLLVMAFQEEKKKRSVFAIAMIIMGIAFFISFFSFIIMVPVMGVMGLIVGIIALIVGLIAKFGKNLL